MSRYPVLTEDVIFSYLTHRSIDKKRKTFNKGKDYYYRNRIYDIQRSADYSIFKAKSIGSNGETWVCSLRFENGKLVSHDCTCPAHANYGGPCKHQIALMYCLEEARQEEIQKRKQFIEYEAEKIICLECGKAYNIKEDYCPQCGCPTSENLPIQQAVKSVVCTECGKVYSDKEEYCPQCGCPTSENIGSANENGSSKETFKEVKITPGRKTEKTEEKKQPVKQPYQSKIYTNEQYKTTNEDDKKSAIDGGCILQIIAFIAILIFVIYLFAKCLSD